MYELNYAILRLIPNARRQEVVNIGFAAFLDDEIIVKTIKKYGKVLALCPDYQVDLFPSLQDDIRFMLDESSSYDDVSSLLQSMGGFMLGPCTSLHYESKKDLREKFEDIMRSYVYPETNRSDSKWTSSYNAFRKKLTTFTSVSSDPADLDRHTVVERLPIDSEGWLRMDFAFRSGEMINFIQTVDLHTKDRRELLRTIAAKRLAGDVVKTKYGSSARISILQSSSTDAVNAGADYLKGYFETYADRVINANSESKLNEFAESIAWEQGPFDYGDALPCFRFSASSIKSRIQPPATTHSFPVTSGKRLITKD